MNNIIKKEDLLAYIQSKIYVIRGKKVMLDRDLAELYGVETRTLNQRVKRNLRRFPSDFMFQMTKEDIEEWKSQIVISNSIKMGLRKSPKAFTLFGVAMLSSVLNSETAIDTNIDIMRAFVEYKTIRDMVKYGEFQELQEKLERTNSYIEEISPGENTGAICFILLRYLLRHSDACSSPSDALRTSETPRRSPCRRSARRHSTIHCPRPTHWLSHSGLSVRLHGCCPRRCTPVSHRRPHRQSGYRPHPS